MKPVVSILMSVYKEDNALLNKCIQSILTQTYSNFEFIIVDDGASAENISLIKSFHDLRIKLIRNPKNIGLTKSLNVAIKNSKGNYIARIDSDDFSHEERLSKQIDFLQKNRQYILCGSMSLELNSGVALKQHTKFYQEHSQIIQAICSMNPFTHSTIMLTRSAIDSIGGYDESFKYAQDYQLVYQLSKVGKLYNIPIPLVTRTIDQGRISFSHYKEQLKCSMRTRNQILFDSSIPLRLKVSTVISLLKSIIRLYTKKTN